MGPLDIWERLTWMTSSLHRSVLPDEFGREIRDISRALREAGSYEIRDIFPALPR